MPDYTTLRCDVTDGVAAVILDNPPLNLVSPKMIEELDQLFEQLRDDDRVRVVTFESANSDFSSATRILIFSWHPETRFRRRLIG